MTEERSDSNCVAIDGSDRATAGTLRWKIALGAFVLGVVGLVYWAWLGIDAARWVVTYTGYYVCLVLFILFIVTLVRSHRRGMAPMRELWKTHSIGICASLALAGFVQLHEPYMMRVYFDEPSHMAVSLMMHEDRMAVNPSKAHYQFGNLIFLDRSPPFRTILYSFLVSGAHDLTGYRVANGHAVNALLTVILFLMVYAIGHRFRGRWGGILGILFLATLPLLASTATSAGYDILNLLFLAVFLYAGLRFAEQGGGANLNFLVATGLLLSLSRNESVLFLPCIPLIVAARWWATRRLELTWIAVLSPLVLLLHLSFKVILDHTPQVVLDHVRERGLGLFALEFIPVNLSSVVHFLFTLDSTSANSLILSVFGAVSLVFFLVRAVRHLVTPPGWRTPPELFLILYIGTGAAIFILFLAHFWPTAENQAIRLVLPAHLMGVWAILWVSREWKFGNRFLQTACVVVAAFLFLFTIPANSRGFLTHASVMSHYHRHFFDYVHRHDDGKTLYVMPSSLSVLIHRLPAVSIHNVNPEPENLAKCIKEGLYDRVVFFELRRVDPGSLELAYPHRAAPISDTIVRERIESRRYFHNQVGVLSRMVGVVDEEGVVVLLDDYEYERPLFESDVELLEYLGSILP